MNSVQYERVYFVIRVAITNMYDTETIQQQTNNRRTYGGNLKVVSQSDGSQKEVGEVLRMALICPSPK
ncbi:MAG: hypothetical protein M3P08_10075 [Thermoproteota archaeon]|jgi:hypothetical protein|nr:hypothetical protein [Thermoproteota archaeon]